MTENTQINKSKQIMNRMKHKQGVVHKIEA